MRRARRIGAAALATAAALVALGYWSGTNAPIDVVGEGRRILGIDLRSAMVPTNGIRLHEEPEATSRAMIEFFG